MVIKQAYAGLVGFVVEGAKINADPLFIQYACMSCWCGAPARSLACFGDHDPRDHRGVLQEHQLKASRIDFITGLYDTVRAPRATTLHTAPHHAPLTPWCI